MTRDKLSGFSLLEMVIALFVVGLGVVGLLTLLLQGMVLISDVELRDKAVILAHRTVEELKSDPLNGHGVIEKAREELAKLSFPTGSTLDVRWDEPHVLKITRQSKQSSEDSDKVHEDIYYQIHFSL
ncbi:MAG: prepilin-type N-terminal cleavage/methylation domain-containing protein [Gammaproteobacteria bacterium]|nr:prepilin-type N-terminal cleavage/methylation domain-containing protein [Gammaproteobacteria bacterium]